MAKLSSLLSSFRSRLLLLLYHLGCFNFTSPSSSSSSSDYLRSKKRKLPPFPSDKQCNSSPPPPSRIKLTPGKALSYSRSFLKRIFASKPCSTTKSSSPTPPLRKLSIPHYRRSKERKLSPDSSNKQCQSSTRPPSSIKLSSRKALSSSCSFLKRIFSSKPCCKTESSTPTPPLNKLCIPSPSSSARALAQPIEATIPVAICGEIFPEPDLLEQHHSMKHVVSELLDSDIGKNVVNIIFKNGWPEKIKNPTIHRILKIHNSPKMLTRFEEFRESVMSKATRNGTARDERCIADGNELLRFHCTTFQCDLGQNGNPDLCKQQNCSVCGIISTGFSPKMDGISTTSTSWRAHMAIPDEIEEEFKFMHVKRAMLVCRVIAGQVGCEPGIGDEEDGGYDSLVGCGGTGIHSRLREEEELLVFNPRAVLPCFVVVYSV